VENVLEELEALDKPRIRVLNKIDLLNDEERAALPADAAAVSAAKGDGIDELLRRIDAALPSDPLQIARFRLPQKNGALLSMLYDHARVIERRFHDGVVDVRAELSESLARRLHSYRVEG
jgi:GTP-binding protein HflX